MITSFDGFSELHFRLVSIDLFYEKHDPFLSIVIFGPATVQFELHSVQVRNCFLHFFVFIAYKTYNIYVPSASPREHIIAHF